MIPADVSGTGSTEYLSIKVVHVTIFSRSGMPRTLPGSQGIPAGKMIENPGESSSALLPSCSTLTLEKKVLGSLNTGRDFLGGFAAGSSPAPLGRQSEEWAGQIHAEVR